MVTSSRGVATISTLELQSKEINENSIKVSDDNYLDLNSIAKDPNARYEILENESFIDELCEKVFQKLRAKLGNFCGANCSANCNANCSG